MGEQMVHIALSNVIRFNQITGIKPPFPTDFDEPLPADMDWALKFLENSFDYVIAVGCCLRSLPSSTSAPGTFLRGRNAPTPMDAR